jgi:hypothetical protein
MRRVADFFDLLAALGAIGAAWFLFKNLPTVETGPEFVQIGLMALLLAVVPYCLAGAIHRIWRRG